MDTRYPRRLLTLRQVTRPILFMTDPRLGEGACGPSADRRLPYPRTSYASRTGAGPKLTLVPFYELRMYGVLGSSGMKSPLGEIFQWAKISYPTVP
jgi:hypothetical protein